MGFQRAFLGRVAPPFVVLGTKMLSHGSDPGTYSDNVVLAGLLCDLLASCRNSADSG